ncbi:MAG: hypothetical protein E6K81_11720 [Candidatus Eisenbacteria bacterium]|uniref:FlgD/Vpr Ig-like domain-containing protein n=1 Tax=Eiseniibacteriota bacterium TaxID=2212470 RepID=A0A538U4M0_UNCEI|nr:MAG: hypothetical protein E6K81_11720 [Candidatus Eisenbacteria bacterium]
MRRLAVALLLAAAGAWPALPARAESTGGQSQAEYDQRVRESKARARELITQGAQNRIAAARRWAAAARAARRRGHRPARGSKARPAPRDEDERTLAGDDRDAGRGLTPQRLGATTLLTTPTNVRANNPAGDGGNTAQSEENIAARGNDVLIAWNDGLGPHIQGYGYSTDGGLTFTDGGAPPALAGWTWTSDPVVTVNEKTGVFYYCGLVAPNASTSGIGIVPATFAGAALNWGTPVLVRGVDNSVAVLDKEWLAADSLSGNLYLTYTTFDAATGDHIEFQRSTNGGSSWSNPVQLSAPGDNGGVQGPRPAVGPAGEVYATWGAVGPFTQDFIRLRKSTNQGVSCNRERGIDFPSIAVDRTTGTHRGRVHLAWTESMNKYDDAVGTLGNVVEREENGFFGRANAFVAGQTLRGAFVLLPNQTTDLDYFSFPAVQGKNYLFECDSIPDPLYSMRVFCGQDTTAQLRLAFSGDVISPAGGRGYIIWTAPTTGTYYLRMAYLAGALGGYRISTATAGLGPERGRDSRDVFAAYSDNGTAWSVPATRVNDAAPFYDEFLPEIMVGPDGMPYVTWFDWRDDGCGGRSFQYLARSTDGGTTWSANQPFSSVQNNWTAVATNIAPNMGDYNHIATDGRYLRPAWADGRNLNPDVFTTRIDTSPQISLCQSDAVADSASLFSATWTVHNLNPMFGNAYDYGLSSERSWPMPAGGSLSLGADGSGDVHLDVAVPDTATSGVNHLCLTVVSANGALRTSCCFALTVNGSQINPPPPPPVYALALGAGVPNPAVDLATIDFTLPHEGRVRLTVYDLRGRRVATLIDGDRPAGPSTTTWDGRDHLGRPVPAGTYFFRLEAFGQTRVKRLAWLR